MNQSADYDAIPPIGPLTRDQIDRITLAASAPRPIETDRIETDLTEWAIQCYTRDGDLHTGRHFVAKREAIESGERLERINGAEWWLVSRTRIVTVETSPWSRAIPPERSQA